MEEKTKIDVYSDKFKTINVIDFEKLKKEALRLKEISDKYKQKNKILNISDIIVNYIGITGVIIFCILLIINTKASELHIAIFATFILIFLYLILVMLPYNFIKRAVIGKKRKKFFPQDVPQEIIYDIKSKLRTEDIEKILYIYKVLILPGIPPNHIEYKILDTIESQEKNDFLLKAYNIKANVIINYQSHKYTISTVKSSGLTKVRSIDTKHKTETNIIGTAVQVISENKDYNTNKSNDQL